MNLIKAQYSHEFREKSIKSFIENRIENNIKKNSFNKKLITIADQILSCDFKNHQLGILFPKKIVVFDLITYKKVWSKDFISNSEEPPYTIEMMAKGKLILQNSKRVFCFSWNGDEKCHESSGLSNVKVVGECFVSIYENKQQNICDLRLCDFEGLETVSVSKSILDSRSYRYDVHQNNFLISLIEEIREEIIIGTISCQKEINFSIKNVFNRAIFTPRVFFQKQQSILCFNFAQRKFEKGVDTGFKDKFKFIANDQFLVAFEEKDNDRIVFKDLVNDSVTDYILTGCKKISTYRIYKQFFAIKCFMQEEEYRIKFFCLIDLKAKTVIMKKKLDIFADKYCDFIDMQEGRLLFLNNLWNPAEHTYQTKKLEILDFAELDA